MKHLEQTQLQNQKGFTLVEIAIVLVIIGLLLGGVLKGQELIENTKLKAVKTDSDAIQAAVLGYQDRFRALPGDDSLSATHVPTATAIAGNGNGSIEAGGEDVNAWDHMRAAGFMSGSGITPPINSFGGNITMVSTATGLRICQPGLTAEQMLLVDSRYDDGNGSTTGAITGAITGFSDAAGATASAADYSDAVIICITY